MAFPCFGGSSSTEVMKAKVTREHAIALVRQSLLKLVDEDHSICEVAARKGILCRGLRRYSDGQLAERYWWIANRRTSMTREEIEGLANRWQLARQMVHQAPLACDVQRFEHDTCGGWDDFTDQELEGFCRELTGAEVQIAAP